LSEIDLAAQFFANASEINNDFILSADLPKRTVVFDLRVWLILAE
jgi:hypothetical protein